MRDKHPPPSQTQWSVSSDWAIFVSNAANRIWEGPLALCHWEIIGLGGEGGGKIFGVDILSNIKHI